MIAHKEGAEFTAFDDADVRLVTRVLEAHAGPDRAVTEKHLARLARMPERRFRAILTAFDGVRWVCGKVNRAKNRPGGIYLARSMEEAASLDAELRAKHTTLGHRLGRRDGYWGPRQGVMDFGKGEAA